MSEFKEMKFWIGDDPELYGMVVKILEDKGYVAGNKPSGRSSSCKNIALTAGKSGMFHSSYYQNETGFKGWIDYEEINIDWMRTKKPETIELGGKTYIKAELEEALKHIKPVE